MEASDLKKQRFFCFAIGMFNGLLIYLLMYGVGRLHFCNDNWIYSKGGDLLQHYLGWQFFRHGDWQFPIGLTDWMSYPTSISMLYTDSIPLFAIIFKLFRHILPETFQYFGLYGLLCFMLQGGMGSLITNKFSSSKVVCALAGIVFIVSPVMLRRMYGHTSLSSHFLILLALYLWLCCEEIKPLKAAIIWAGLGILCVGIHLYFIPMLGMILVGFCLRKWMEKKYKLLQCMGLLLAYCLPALFALYAIGGFYGDFADYSDSLGDYGANLNTLFNGMGKSAFLPELPYLYGQYEGFGYLGVGVMVLLLLGVAGFFLKRYRKEIQISKTVFLSGTCILVLATVLAVGIRICFNQHELLAINLPGFLQKLLGLFRASGRFIWVTVYVLEICAVKYVATCFAGNVAKEEAVLGKTMRQTAGTAVPGKVMQNMVVIAVLGICAALQLADMQIYFANRKLETKALSCETATWQELAQTYDKVVPLQGLELYPLMDLAGYAARNEMKISQFYFARGIGSTIQYNIDRTKEQLLAGNADEKAIYILPAMAWAEEFGLDGYSLNGILIGLKQKILFKELEADKTQEIVIAGNQCLTNGEDTPDGRILHPQGISFGPYIGMEPGTYRVTVEGEGLWDMYFDVYSNANQEMMPVLDSVANEEKLQYTFTLNQGYTDLEFRFENRSDAEKCIRHLYLTRIE